MDPKSNTTKTQAIELMDGPIIIIDDDPDILLSLELLISKKFPDKEILATDKGSRGLNWLDTVNHSFLIIDLALRDMNGIHVALKSLITHPRIPILVISGSVDMEDYKKTTRNVMKMHYLKKPFRGSDLIPIMEAAYKSLPDSTIKGMKLTNTLQLVAEEVDYAHLEITSNGNKGVITIENNMILFAATEIAVGKKALLELLQWKNIEVSIYYRRRTNRNNINEPVHALLLEMCQHADLQIKAEKS